MYQLQIDIKTPAEVTPIHGAKIIFRVKFSSHWHSGTVVMDAEFGLVVSTHEDYLDFKAVTEYGILPE